MDDKRLEQEMKNLEGNAIVLFVIKGEDYIDTNFQILRHLVEDRESCGIYITVNRPYESLQSLLKKNDVPTDDIFFIDMISQMSGEATKRKDNCLFLPSPQNLTDLGVALSEITESIQDRKYFIFLDSLSTLLIYNHFDIVARFSHFLTAKMRRLNVDGIFLSLNQKDDSELISIMCQVCDKIINLADPQSSTHS